MTSKTDIEKLKISPVSDAEQKDIESILNKRTGADKKISRSEKTELEISRAEAERGDFTELEDFTKGHNLR
ncbi:MAG: hypothetical protein K9J16_09295 [Melioribacteraceae bacterium]|nr:hypothetical protein [Melioribacteraceae bacterium]MCF8355998.1 hypothetical protein [Melioribacteraceae bacterium]MCF8419593.1 hypothetical protein [Melioribacteraceae bacterium]